jgi:hypothetical protein
MVNGVVVHKCGRYCSNAGSIKHYAFMKRFIEIVRFNLWVESTSASSIVIIETNAFSTLTDKKFILHKTDHSIVSTCCRVSTTEQQIKCKKKRVPKQGTLLLATSRSGTKGILGIIKESKTRIKSKLF